ncbi:hypothetical protein HC766_06115 [Candidatus Gracilibacteria bacterium]|nr:hypothetical protein [Candidatus Gracilibacteria bacterium]NJS41861.1 hypothetical protein [Candidatus Gracilibacteria bacterium]
MPKQKNSNTGFSYFLSVFLLINFLSFGFSIYQALNIFSGKPVTSTAASMDPNNALIQRLELLEQGKKNNLIKIETLEEKNDSLDGENINLREIIHKYEVQLDEQNNLVEKLLQEKSSENSEHKQ